MVAYSLPSPKLKLCFAFCAAGTASVTRYKPSGRAGVPANFFAANAAALFCAAVIAIFNINRFATLAMHRFLFD